jgi:hypothetical protein
VFDANRFSLSVQGATCNSSHTHRRCGFSRITKEESDEDGICRIGEYLDRLKVPACQAMATLGGQPITFHRRSNQGNASPQVGYGRIAKAILTEAASGGYM